LTSSAGTLQMDQVYKKKVYARMLALLVGTLPSWSRQEGAALRAEEI
jgi:hypothetical protein